MERIEHVYSKKVKVYRRVDRHKDKVYEYGLLKVSVPRELIGKEVRVIILPE